MEERPKLLVFGGTAFIGKSFLDYLGFTKQNYEIFCLNRGTVYWYVHYHSGTMKSEKIILKLPTSTATEKNQKQSNKPF